MRRITITDGASIVVLQKDLEFDIKPEFVGETATMASGRTVRDHVGIKNALHIPTGWLSPQDLNTLCRMIGAGNVLTVRYPDVDGEREAEFWLTPPERRAFSYDADGVRQWYGVELTAEQYGVSPLTVGTTPSPLISASISDGGFIVSSGVFGASLEGGGISIA